MWGHHSLPEKDMMVQTCFFRLGLGVRLRVCVWEKDTCGRRTLIIQVGGMMTAAWAPREQHSSICCSMKHVTLLWYWKAERQAESHLTVMMKRWQEVTWKLHSTSAASLFCRGNHEGEVSKFCQLFKTMLLQNKGPLFKIRPKSSWWCNDNKLFGNRTSAVMPPWQVYVLTSLTCFMCWF